MDEKLGDTVSHRLNVAEKTSFKPLDPSDHNATNRTVGSTRRWPFADRHSDLNEAEPTAAVRARTPARVTMP